MIRWHGVLVVAVIATIVGCSTHSGALKLGPDTYSVSAGAAPALGGIAGAQKIALTEANKHCAQSGQEILVTNISTQVANVYGAGTADITFRCLDKGDPALVRPTYQTPPSTVIEDRRK